MLKPPLAILPCRLRRSASLLAGFSVCLFLVLDGCGAGSSAPATEMPTASISATPSSINAGGSAVLAVAATNATQVTVTGSDGTAFDLSASGGSQSVSPKATTTYTVTATGSAGKSSATTTVSVAPTVTPVVSETAAPATITAGMSSTLTVTASNATQVTVDGTDGTSYSLPSNGGTQTVSPSQTTTYTATAINGGGQASASATVTVSPAPTVTIAASHSSIVTGSSAVLTVNAANATTVVVTGTDGSSYPLQSSGGTQTVSPVATTTYTATATGQTTTASAKTTITVSATSSPGIQSIDHVIFMLQENRSFDAYFGMLNPYREGSGWNVGDDGKTYTVDGIDDKLTSIVEYDHQNAPFQPFKFSSTCIDNLDPAWQPEYRAVSWKYLSTRPILMNGFVDDAQNLADYCAVNSCGTVYTDTTGQHALGYYDQDYLNYYYFMASQFALSDRWFAPVSSGTISNRIATFTGGTTQGLVHDPGYDDHLPQLNISNIFQELDQAGVSWKIYYTVTQGFCTEEDDCPGSGSAKYPATAFLNLSYSWQYLHGNSSGGSCASPTQPSSVVGDSSNSFCIDPNHIAPLSTYFSDLSDGTLPSFAFIETGYGLSDEHPGPGISILNGQVQEASIINALMTSSAWMDSVLFFSYDEGGGAFDHVPPVPGHSNDFTDAVLGSIPDIESIAVNADGYNPCVPAGGTPTLHCDLWSTDPGSNSGDAPAVDGFAAQLGSRLPNIIISPFTRRHYVSHTPMDHTAVIKFVENRFIGSATHLTARDAAQPDLLEFFDFNNVPWASPPTPPAPVTAQSLGYDPCTPASFAP